MLQISDEDEIPAQTTVKQEFASCLNINNFESAYDEEAVTSDGIVGIPPPFFVLDEDMVAEVVSDTPPVLTQAQANDETSTAEELGAF